MKVARRALMLFAVIVAAATLLACTLLLDDSQVQCASTADCRARGPAFANAVCVASVCQQGDAGAASDAGSGPWDCLEGPPIPSPVGMVDVEIVLYSALGTTSFGGSVPGGNDLTLLSYTPQPGVNVAACQSLDTACSTPIMPTTSDDAGIARLSVPGAFDGFYTLTRSDSVSSLFFPGRLLEGEPSVTFPTSLTSTASYSRLQVVTGIAANQDTDGGPGLVAVTQYDCNDLRASGVTFAVNPAAARIVYVAANGLPSTSALATAANGAGLIVNAPAGDVTITSSLAAPGNRGLDTESVLVRSGGITLVKLRPRAR